MHIGVNVPITELKADVAGLRDFVQAAEELGYAHLRILDHVLGANPQFHPEVPEFPYTHQSYLHEPLTLMSYLAAITTRLHLVTAILILPQRQTALVAKQAAEVDVLSGGRLRLGIGVGWNPVEYEALGEDFHNRGRRCEEQIAVLRALWTQEVVEFTGQWHQISHAGLNPLPIQRPISIWIGAGRSARPIPPDAALRRIGRLADGWFPMFSPGEEGRQAIARMHDHARQAGRDPAAIGIEGRVTVAGKAPQEWLAQVKAWRELGASHLSVGTGGGGFKSPQEHIDALRRFKAAMDGSSSFPFSHR
jgi:probable F420-dependent oxidoreductase